MVPSRTVRHATRFRPWPLVAKFPFPRNQSFRLSREAQPGSTSVAGIWLRVLRPVTLNTTENTQGRLAYKLNEAAALLGVSVITIRRAIDRGLIRPSRAFRHVLISATELQRFLDTTSGTGKEGA